MTATDRSAADRRDRPPTGRARAGSSTSTWTRSTPRSSSATTRSSRGRPVVVGRPAVLARRGGGVQLRGAPLRHPLGDAERGGRQALPRRGVRAAALRRLPRRVGRDPRGVSRVHGPDRAAVARRGLPRRHRRRASRRLGGAHRAPHQGADRRAHRARGPSAGVSYNKFLAKVASDHDKPDGLFWVLPADGEAFVATLPIGRFPRRGAGDRGAHAGPRYRDRGGSRALEPGGPDARIRQPRGVLPPRGARHRRIGP